MAAIPAVVTRKLAGEVYRRPDADAVRQALSELGTPVPEEFQEFYETYAGPFGSARTGFELHDLCEGAESILRDTRTRRVQFGWPDRFLVLTVLLGGGVLVLDASTGNVLDVDFEGGDQLMLQGTLEPRWESFAAFLEFYFSDP